MDEMSAEKVSQSTVDGRIYHPRLAGVRLSDPNIFNLYANETANEKVPDLPGLDGECGDAGVVDGRLSGIPLTDPMVGPFMLLLHEDLTPEDDFLPIDASRLDPKLEGLKYTEKNFGVEYLRRLGKLSGYLAELRSKQNTKQKKGESEWPSWTAATSPEDLVEERNRVARGIRDEAEDDFPF